MSGIKTNKLAASTGTTISVPSGTTIYNPGRIVQVKNTYLQSEATISITSGYNNYQDITGLSVTISPYKATSRFYIVARVFCEASSTNMATWDSAWVIKRNGYAIGRPPQPGPGDGLPLAQQVGSLSYWSNDADSTPEIVFWDYVDTPNSLGPHVYQVALASTTGGTIYLNRTVNGATSGGYERGTSSLTVWEIAS